jgi:hypothetical protein
MEYAILFIRSSHRRLCDASRMTRNGKYPYGYRSSLASVGDANATRKERDFY